MPFREAFAESDDLDKWWQEQFGGDQVDDAKAKSVQQRLLRALPQPNGYELAAFYEPHDTIGGDFYDCVQIDDNRIFFILADVSGHGVGGALIVASALKSLRYLYRQTDDLIEIMSRLNEDIHDDLLKEQFITAFAGIIKLDEAELTCVCCGHHPAIIGNAGSATPLTLIGSPGMALGLVKGSTFARTLRPAVVDLEDGDILLQCTDGILEAMDEDDEAFGILRGYASSISRLDQDLQDLVDGMAEGADAFAGDQAIDDDVTIFALKVLEPNEDDEELDEDGEASDFDQSSLSPDSALSASKQSSDGAIERHEGAS
jgi:sigma-B regulation protein RsbU (phosphoserine phosphatase)